MKVTASAGSLNVEDVAASSRFLQQHFGFAEVMAAGGFASPKGVPITMPLTCEEWGKRAFSVRDPNGVTIQLAGWNAPTATGQSAMTCSSALPATTTRGNTSVW